MNKKLIRPSIMSDAFSRNMIREIKWRACIKCGETFKGNGNLCSKCKNVE